MKQLSNHNQQFPVSNLNTKSKIRIVLITIALLAAIGTGVYYISQRQRNTSEIQQLNTITPLFTGKLKVSQDLGLLYNSELSTYYEAGQFIRGDFKGYTRIIAVGPNTIEGAQVFTLATKDFKNYILDNSNNENEKSDFYLDKNKITSIKKIDAELPQELVLSNYFSLYKDNILTTTNELDQKDTQGNNIRRTTLVTNFSKYKWLTQPVKNIQANDEPLISDPEKYKKNTPEFINPEIYFQPYTYNAADANNLTGINKELYIIKQKYLLNNTTVIVLDSTGLPYSYSITTPIGIAKYTEEQKISEIPNTPGLSFNSSQINSQSNIKFYDKYNIAIPGACALGSNSKIVNISDDELEKIGTVNNLALYKLKDNNNPLYTLAYKNKTQYYDKDISKPTLEEYISKTPLLFIKDYWQRTVALGEYDILLPGGCGKPVIYLYPENPTQVKVQFQTPIQLTTDIPKYCGYWQVLAQPNGNLTNLRPELTDCSTIDTNKKGSEYAKNACLTNTYPYLYWAGNVTTQNYPEIKSGWVVSKNELNEFLKTKLSDMGLNQNEKSDFIGYWLPDMLSKNAPYYRISFLQTQELNSLFPMSVTPKPDTIFRVFLDYLPLTSKPTIIPEPQILNKLTRNGFTLVEWGGLKFP